MKPLTNDSPAPSATGDTKIPSKERNAPGRSSPQPLAQTDPAGLSAYPPLAGNERLGPHPRSSGNPALGSIRAALAYFGPKRPGWSPEPRPADEGPSLDQLKRAFPTFKQDGNDFDLDGTHIPTVGAIRTHDTAPPVLYALDETNQQARIIGTRAGLAPFLDFLLFVAGTNRDLSQKSARQLFESRQPIRLSGTETHLKIEPLEEHRFGLNLNHRFKELVLTTTGSEPVSRLVANYICPPVLNAALVATYAHRRAAHLMVKRTFGSPGPGIYVEMPMTGGPSWRRLLVMPHNNLIDAATRLEAAPRDPRLGDVRLLLPNKNGVKIHWEGGLMARIAPEDPPTRFSIVSMMVIDKAYPRRLDRAVSMVLKALVPSESNGS